MIVCALLQIFAPERERVFQLARPTKWFVEFGSLFCHLHYKFTT